MKQSLIICSILSLFLFSCSSSDINIPEGTVLEQNYKYDNELNSIIEYGYKNIDQNDILSKSKKEGTLTEGLIVLVISIILFIVTAIAIFSIEDNLKYDDLLLILLIAFVAIDLLLIIIILIEGPDSPPRLNLWRILLMISNILTLKWYRNVNKDLSSKSNSKIDKSYTEFKVKKDDANRSKSTNNVILKFCNNECRYRSDKCKLLNQYSDNCPFREIIESNDEFSRNLDAIIKSVNKYCESCPLYDSSSLACNDCHANKIKIKIKQLKSNQNGNKFS